MEEEEERGRGMKAPRGREVASAGSPRGGVGGEESCEVVHRPLAAARK